jgi:uncharacterized protein
MPDARALRSALRRRLALLPGDDVAAFRAGLAVIAVAIFDDAFVTTQPGVGAGDHLASGLIPLTVVGLLIAFAPRICARLRGWLALLTGTLAVVGGVADRSFTAVAAALAGAALIGLGVTTLWRTRRTTGSLGARVLRRVAVGVGVLAVTVLVVLPIGIALVATHKVRTPVTAADLGRPSRDVALVTSDGFRLRARYVPSRNGAAVIAFPGRVKPVPHARMLVRHGYGVLLLDRRGEGASEGDYNAFGWSGERDLRAAIAFLQRQPDVDPDRIGGLGLSVGGELLLQTAAHTHALRAVVSEGAGQRSLAEHLDNPEIARVQRWISGMVAQTAAVAVLSNSAPPAGLADLMPRIAPRPTLLIQAARGNPDEILNEVYAARGGPSSRRWLVTEGGHTGALAAAPAAYERRVIAFFDRALLRPPPRGTT